MKKYTLYLNIILAFILSSCQNDSDFAIQQPDSSKIITFSASTEKHMTRAASYATYTTDNRPNTMGVFGGYGSVYDNIFNNQEVDYESPAWGYTPVQKWGTYSSQTPFDFFAYMPYTSSGVSLNKSDNTYTLSYPVTITGDMAPLTTNETALICNMPYHTSTSGVTISFEMDQTLTGYRLLFELGEKMDNVRDITITAVSLDFYNMSFYTGGTVSRTFTNNDGVTWTSGDITWSSLTTKTETTKSISVIHPDSTLTLNHTAFQQWGEDFFMIPVANFTPTISVTYDVTLNDEGETTRKSVSSTIALNSTNFKSYDSSVPGATGTIYPIQIKIVPSYLYVLADADQATGYIVIE